MIALLMPFPFLIFRCSASTPSPSRVCFAFLRTPRTQDACVVVCVLRPRVGRCTSSAVRAQPGQPCVGASRPLPAHTPDFSIASCHDRPVLLTGNLLSLLQVTGIAKC
jgi:hypothetical protein